VCSAIRLRPRAKEFREKLRDRGGVLLPDSPGEQRWFAAISIGGGISEELVYRGFLIYYLSTYIPQLSELEKALLTSLIFGMAHLYQGWRGVAAASLSGCILAGFYLLSGSLLLPILVHITGNMRVPMIFWSRLELKATAEPPTAQWLGGEATNRTTKLVIAPIAFGLK
jgi:membrane protease YdiL (CAAX protease family)